MRYSSQIKRSLNRNPYTNFGKPKRKSKIKTFESEALHEIDLLKRESKTVAKHVAAFFEETTKGIGELWNYRSKRIALPTYLLLMKKIITSFATIMQVLLFLMIIQDTAGHLSNLSNTSLIMLPWYGRIITSIVVDGLGIMLVAERALKEESKLDKTLAHHELGRFKPVIPHALHVIAYSIYLLAMISIGTCHLKYTKGEEKQGMCQSMDIQVVNALMGIWMTLQLLIKGYEIYLDYKHTSNPSLRSKDEENRAYSEEGPMGKLVSMDQSLTKAWSFWEVKMNRIFGANITHHLTDLWSTILVGAFNIHLVNTIYNSGGNMGNIKNWPSQLFLLYISFFGIAIISTAVLMYSHCTHFSLEQPLVFIKHYVNHPNVKWVSLTHMIFAVVYSVYGFLSITISHCHLDPTVNRDETLCKYFTLDWVVAIITLIGVAEFVHYSVQMYITNQHCSKPVHQGSELPEDVKMKVTRSQIGDNDFRHLITENDL